MFPIVKIACLLKERQDIKLLQKHKTYTAQLTARKSSNPETLPSMTFICSSKILPRSSGFKCSPSPQKRRCLEVKITSKQQDQTEHPQTPSPEIFLTHRNYLTIPFVTHSTSPPIRCGPYHFSWKAGKNLLIFRMALLKTELTLACS